MFVLSGWNILLNCYRDTVKHLICPFIATFTECIGCSDWNKSVVIQAIDNDIGVISPIDIIKTIEEIVDICRSRFPNLAEYVVEPLGRCLVDSPHVYWRTAARVCGMRSSVTRIKVIAIPTNLKTAYAAFVCFQPTNMLSLCPNSQPKTGDYHWPMVVNRLCFDGHESW